MSREILPAPTPAILNLGPDYYDPVQAADFPDRAQIRYRNASAAKLLGLESLTDPEWLQHFFRFQSFAGNLPSPLALRYHGHQFTHYNPDLGDGRGFLFAQFMGTDGLLYDLGTKGSGQTPYSRAGDGRLTLKGAVREILATEMLESLGVTTSKTLSVVETGESLSRNDEPSPTRAAVLVRMNHGHIRIGTFQRLAYLEQANNIRKLVAYCAHWYYPEIAQGSDTSKGVGNSSCPDDGADVGLAADFLTGVVRRSAKLAAEWMFAGFVHGVLNSDNINISGESFDYGPFRFLPTYDVKFTAAYFDHQGLYCFGRQPISMLWNLEQLALSLRFAYAELAAEDILANYADAFNEQVRKLMLRRLNLKSLSEGEDAELLVAYFGFLEKSQVLYEQCFFDFYGGMDEERLRRSPQATLYRGPEFDVLASHLRAYSVSDQTKLAHPYFAGASPCTMLIDELEALWKPIAEQDDWSTFTAKLTQIRAFRGLY